MSLMSLKKILLWPTSRTLSEHGKEKNGIGLFTTRDKKEESGKTDAVHHPFVPQRKTRVGGRPTPPLLVNYQTFKIVNP